MPQIPAPIADENSQAVVAYRLTKVEEAVSKGFEEHNKRLEALINNFATKEDIKNVEKAIAANAAADDTRLSSLESDRQWIVRALILAVIVTVLGAVGIGYKVIN